MLNPRPERFNAPPAQKFANCTAAHGGACGVVHKAVSESDMGAKEMKKVYQRGRYRVEVGDDGAIQVWAGDWLSKYSAAIHNDFFHVKEYGRKNPKGAVLPVQNINIIFAGETLYHFPTYRAWRKTQVLRMPEENITGSAAYGIELTDAQKRALIEQHMKQDYGLRGENLNIIGNVVDIIGYADNVVALAEIAGLLVEGTALAGAATGLAALNAILTPIACLVPALNAREIGERLMGMRAVAYATTAWAFNDARPSPSAAILVNLRNSPVYTMREHENYIYAWNTSVDATYRNLEAEVTKRGVRKANYQVLLQAGGKGNRAALCRLVMQGFEKQLDTSGLRVWKMNYTIEYPR